MLASSFDESRFTKGRSIPSCLKEHFSKFVLIRELLIHMTPLFVVSTHGASANNIHFVAVPPDSALEQFAVPGTSGERKRLFQSVVRSHLFHGTSVGHLESLGGHSAVLQLVPAENLESSSFTSRPGSAPSTPGSARLRDKNCKYLSLSVTTAAGISTMAQVLKSVELTGNAHFTFLFVDRSLHQAQSVSRSTLVSVRSFVSGSQPLWQRIPCSAMKVMREWNKQQQRIAGGEAASKEGTGVTPTQHLLAMFKADDQSFRRFVVDFTTEKGDQIVFRRMSIVANGGPAVADDGRNIALAMRQEAATTAKVQSALHSSMDRAMMMLDTEVAMFLSSYVVVDGFEEFTVAKVMQLVDSVTELALGMISDDCDDMDDCDVAISSVTSDNGSCAQNGGEDDDDEWSEEDQEQLLVAFHTLITGGLAPKLLPHWEEVNYNEDFAFHHACGVLCKRPRSLLNLRASFPDLMPSHCQQLREMIRLLDDRTMSVFGYMRVMEGSISAAVDLVAQTVTNDHPIEVTADICIPLMVYVLAVSTPRCLPSIIKYLLDFCTPVLEMSALGYALTTFEAAGVQLLEEYRVLVTEMADDDDG